MLRTAIVVAIAATIALESSAAARCEPAVRVVGNDELAREVSRDLVFYGITEHASAECPVVQVEVEPAADAIRMSITDPYGTTERSVGAASTAAAIAASWAEELVATLATVARPGAREEPVREDTEPPATHASGISVLYETALDTNRLRWHDFALAACVAVGRVCVGGLGRIGFASAFHPDITRFVPILTRGSGIDLVATVAMPFRFGRLIVAPELDLGVGGVGYEWELDASRSPESTNVSSLRVGARISAALRLGGGFALDAALGVDALPAHYVRYDDPMPPVERFQIVPAVRLAVGIRH